MTFSSVISACSQLGDLRFGLWIEEYMSSIGIELDDHLSTALIDLYSKCAGMDKALVLFEGLEKRESVLQCNDYGLWHKWEVFGCNSFV